MAGRKERSRDLFKQKLLGIPTLLLVVGLNVVTFGTATVHHATEVRARMMVYDLATQYQLSNAAVFLRTGSGTMHRRDLARNGIHFDQSVLYVHDLGERNAELVRAFPGDAETPSTLSLSRRGCASASPPEHVSSFGHSDTNYFQRSV